MQDWKVWKKEEPKEELKEEHEGKTEEKNSIALKMMKGGMPIEQIMQFTGLSEKEIKSL